jgi:hypothetical protein
MRLEVSGEVKISVPSKCCVDPHRQGTHRWLFSGRMSSCMLNSSLITTKTIPRGKMEQAKMRTLKVIFTYPHCQKEKCVSYKVCLGVENPP